jgi:hypothetical protein
MTVSTNTPRQLYSGNGSTTTFAIPFSFDSNSEVVVVLRSSAGVETTQTYTTHYTISGTNVVMVTAPASGAKLLIIRSIPYTQATDLVSGGTYAANDLEAAFDKSLKLIQQLYEIVRRIPQIKRTCSTANLDWEFPEPDGNTNTVLAQNDDGDLEWLSPDDALELPIRAHRCDTVDVTNGATSVVITFSSAMEDALYAVTGLSWVNTADSSPYAQSLMVIARSTTGMTVAWNAPVDSGNYKISYRVDDAV